MKILITGGNGLIGSALQSKINNRINTIYSPLKNELNLLNREQVIDYVSCNKFDIVIHLASKVGGVKANTQYVADFYSENIQINTNIIDACIKSKISKLICCLSTCIYPDEKYIIYPLTEDQLHNGPPHESNFGYAYAKRMTDIHLKAIKQQYGLHYISVIPNNSYGPFDNFDLENSHVIPALIRKIWEAKINNSPYFEVWGDGEVYREFTYSEDISSIILFCLDNYNNVDSINIGNTKEYLLKDIILLICNTLEYKGHIVYNKDKPKGQLRKPTSNKKLLDLGWRQENYTTIENGIKKTCDWFIKNYPNIRGYQ